MGTIDTTIHKLTCPRCDVVQECKVFDKGSGWGGSSWQSGASFSRFEVVWDGGGKAEPHIVSATCSQCGGNAQKESRFGGL